MTLNKDPIQKRFTLCWNSRPLIGWKWSRDFYQPMRMLKFQLSINLRWNFLYRIGSRIVICSQVLLRQHQHREHQAQLGLRVRMNEEGARSRKSQRRRRRGRIPAWRNKQIVDQLEADLLQHRTDSFFSFNASFNHPWFQFNSFFFAEMLLVVFFVHVFYLATFNLTFKCREWLLPRQKNLRSSSWCQKKHFKPKT